MLSPDLMFPSELVKMTLSFSRPSKDLLFCKVDSELVTHIKTVHETFLFINSNILVVLVSPYFIPPRKFLYLRRGRPTIHVPFTHHVVIYLIIRLWSLLVGTNGMNSQT